MIGRWCSQPHRCIFEVQEFYGHNFFFQITTTWWYIISLILRVLILLFILLQQSTTPLSEVEAVDLVKDTFASAAERDIYTVTPTQLEAPVNLMFLNKWLASLGLQKHKFGT
jgi:hypothetical protein